MYPRGKKLNIVVKNTHGSNGITTKIIGREKGDAQSEAEIRAEGIAAAGGSYEQGVTKVYEEVLIYYKNQTDGLDASVEINVEEVEEKMWIQPFSPKGFTYEKRTNLKARISNWAKRQKNLSDMIYTSGNIVKALGLEESHDNRKRVHLAMEMLRGEGKVKITKTGEGSATRYFYRFVDR